MSPREHREEFERLRNYERFDQSHIGINIWVLWDSRRRRVLSFIFSDLIYINMKSRLEKVLIIS